MTTQLEIFPIDDNERPGPAQIIERAMVYEPVAIYSMLSGGDGSLTATAWAMENVPNCQVAHVNTGIGLPLVEEFVRDTCSSQGWPLTVIRAKEDCGQDYGKIVRKYGFPGPAQHTTMYSLLKQRAIRKLVREVKTNWRDKVMLLTGICHDDSINRSGYADGLITFDGAQMWVNHMYWFGKSAMHHYLMDTGLPRNPASVEVGMSCECLCGAYASKNELAMIRRLCPATAQRIERLQDEVFPNHPWKWEEKPPAKRDDLTIDMFTPMCRDCGKRPLLDDEPTPPEGTSEGGGR